ncbi:MAG: hypothetical protein D6701_02150 [Gemmatimonadetes bacterium]|nr:MAG: hypothetical protein D6701_02150 [Gemmatimonadota bacterium]
MEQLFAFLFKYRPLLFQEGELALAAPWPRTTAAAVALVVAAVALSTYTLARGRTRRTDRVVLATLRMLTFAVVGLMLLRPVLVISTVQPQRNFVGVLVDDTRSMTVPGEDGATRADWVRAALTGEASDVFERLGERFALRFYRFSDATTRLADPADLTFAGRRTELGEALTRASEDLAGVPLSGLVVLSDGADNSGRPLAEPLRTLQAAGVPVYTVGVGEAVLSPDVQVTRVEMPRTVLEGTSLLVDVVISQHGFAGRTLPLVVEDAGQLVAREEVTAGEDGEPVVARVRFEAAEAGPRLLEFRVPVQDGERLTRNNMREVLLDVRDRREKILYFEGEPRWEVKFLRRAVADDENLQVVVLQRTAANKFLRLDVDDADELAAGFPRTREELFAYRALVLGSVEASFFTNDQLDMIADFVSERGGGLIVLGGRHAYAQGGYAGTPLEDVLPVFLDDESGAPGPYFERFRVEATRAGRLHPVTRLADDAEASAERWASLPEVSAVNPITRLKPGAVALLVGRPERAGPRPIVLAQHRYGRGRVLALPIQDTWTWQMHADVPVDDLTHETFWRQTLRWLLDGVPDAVTASVERERVEPGESLTLRAAVADSAYEEVNDARVTAAVVDPAGDTTLVRLDWTVDEDGVYEGRFTPPEVGLFEIDVTATREGRPLGSDRSYVHAVVSDEEYFDAAMRPASLRRIAEETGGRFYTPADVHQLPEDLALTGAGVTLTEERDLWDMPVLLLLLLALIGAEWAYRRARGLV